MLALVDWLQRWRHTSVSVVLFRLFGGRLLNMNGGNPIRFRRINGDYAKTSVQIAPSNGYSGLFSRGAGLHLVVNQYRYAKTCSGIAGIDPLYLATP